MLFFHQLAEKWKQDDKTFHEQSQSPSPGVWEAEKRRICLTLGTALQ